eukprot:7036352-Pyramimonas_sp.AAC.1
MAQGGDGVARWLNLRTVARMHSIEYIRTLDEHVEFFHESTAGSIEDACLSAQSAKATSGLVEQELSHSGRTP